MKANIDGIKGTVDKRLDFLKANFNVEKIGVFGSVARGDNDEASDVDMLVKLSEPIGIFKFIKLEEYLSQLIGNKVDLVTQQALKPAIKESIMQEVVYV